MRTEGSHKKENPSHLDKSKGMQTGKGDAGIWRSQTLQDRDRTPHKRTRDLSG